MEQIDERAEADRFLRSLYDWNIYAPVMFSLKAATSEFRET